MIRHVEERARTTQWLAFRTRSRHEKKVRDDLARRGIESFLPLYPRWSRWKDRTMRIEDPLFPGYCFGRFVPGVPGQLLSALRVPGVVGVVSTCGRPEPVLDEEIDAIQRLMDSELLYDPHPFLAIGTVVEVARGPLAGLRGTLLRKDRVARLVLSISLIRQAAAVEIHPADVIVVANRMGLRISAAISEGT